jgi:hypothetical protein
MALELFPQSVQERLALTNTIIRAGESMAAVEQRIAGAVAVSVKNLGVGPPKHPVGVAAADRQSGAAAAAAAPATPNRPSILSNNVEALDPSKAGPLVKAPCNAPPSGPLVNASTSVQSQDPMQAALFRSKPWLMPKVSPIPSSCLRPAFTAPMHPPSPAVSIAGSSERGSQREEDKAAETGLANAAGSGGAGPAAPSRQQAEVNPAGKTGTTIGVKGKGKGKGKSKGKGLGSGYSYAGVAIVLDLL